MRKKYSASLVVARPDGQREAGQVLVQAGVEDYVPQKGAQKGAELAIGRYIGRFLAVR